MRALVIIVAAGTAAGCGDDGQAIPTSEMGIQVFGVVTGPDIAVTATLTTRDPATGQLRQVGVAGGDRLVARAGAAEVELVLGSSEKGSPIHRGDLAGASGPVLEVAFERASEASAPSSSVPLPEPFELIAPPTSHTRGSSLTLEWETGEADTLRVLLAGPDCVAGSEVRFDDDPGAATIDAAAFEPTPTAPDDGPCVAGLQVDRLRDGTADPAFGRGGRVEAVITRAIELAVEY